MSSHVYVHRESLARYLAADSPDADSIYSILARAWESMIAAGILRTGEGDSLAPAMVSVSADGLTVTHNSEQLSWSSEQVLPFDGAIESLAYTLAATINAPPHHKRPWSRN
jgi:hypothetical protein